ncbi:MAG: 16S rRNA (cytidine1402-2'-O)-methyltransferase [Candidatus Azotimanducaceae bacterium]|jgi:16S rRNA (cytidine1402-2'-O)-methyltransferase
MISDFGNLYLIPTTLGSSAPLEVLPLSVKKAVDHIDEYIVENEKTARRFIGSIGSNVDQNKLKFHILNKYTTPEELPTFLEGLKSGKDVGLLSEAGCPGIADPGADVVAMAHEKGIRVVPMIGPSSILLSLMASGLNGQSFAFQGYLPIDKKDRKHKIKELERVSRMHNQTQLFIETPYRNMALLNDLLQHCSPGTRLCIATDISLPSEYIDTKTIADWNRSFPDIHKRPTIFLILS